MRNSSSLDWLRFMHTPNDYRVSQKAFMALDKLKYMELTDEKLKQVKDEADFKIMLDEALKA